MTDHFTLLPGRDAPFGVTPDEKGCNFVLWAPDAERIELCLFDAQEQEITRIRLRERRGHLWYGYVQGVKLGDLYAYRAYGPNNPAHGHLFDPQKLLLDPYAKALSRVLEWDETLYQGDSQRMLPKAVVLDDAFDWQGVVSPRYSDAQTVLYEVHVKGFTKLNLDVPERLRGTYLGLCQPPILHHLQELGITTVQLMPVASFMSEPRLTQLGLDNYWGYNPVCFMAPEPRYALKDAVTEFKTMVRELHRAGIEVILDVVFNHTAEGGDGGPLLSYKGLDNRSYYCFDNGGYGPDFSRYSNMTGCGNTFNVDHPNGLRLVMDSLRYWVTEMHVDGFRFDLAVTLAREGGEFDPYGGFCKALMQDPVLRNVKLISEPWDIGPFGYRLGQFPTQWRELNDRYRDTIRSFWRGDMGRMAEFATRLLGSRDIFPKSLRTIHSSVNFVCYHDGFTLEDTVSYEQRHNQANTEENRDGHGHNLSKNYGIEGPTLDPRITRVRLQQKRNMLLTLLLSQGIPHLLAGDEMGRSQIGNNNAYCQDNRISWVNWQLSDDDESLLAFVKQVVHLRRKANAFTALHLGDDLYFGSREHADSVHWYHPDGSELTEGDWNAPSAQALVMEIIADEGKEHWLVLFNASGYNINFQLTEPAKGYSWQLAADTAVHVAHDHKYLALDSLPQLVAACCAHSMKLLLACPLSGCDQIKTSD
jgi:isoamylase